MDAPFAIQPWHKDFNRDCIATDQPIKTGDVMNHWKSIKAKRKNAKPFVTTHSEIENAVNEYLKNGGKITKLEANDSSYNHYINNGDSSFLADEFLSGR